MNDSKNSLFSLILFGKLSHDTWVLFGPNVNRERDRQNQLREEKRRLIQQWKACFLSIFPSLCYLSPFISFGQEEKEQKQKEDELKRQQQMEELAALKREQERLHRV